MLGSLAVFLLALGFGFVGGVRLALLAASGFAHFDRSRDLALVPGLRLFVQIGRAHV